MSLKYRDNSGNETPVAGLNGTSGEFVPSVSLMQSGTANLPQQNAHSQTDNLTATFTTSMPDTDYTVVFDTLTGNQGYRVLQLQNKTVNGFTFSAFNADVDVATATSIKWTAFKLMTDEVHEADAAHIAQNTANFAPAFSETVSYAVGAYVTYNNVLYRCTTAHTAGVWVAGHFTAVTVGGELDRAVTEVEAGISLDSYTSVNNQYTFPCDGYLQAVADSVGNNARISIQINERFSVRAVQAVQAISSISTLFVKKGMRAYLTERTDSTYCHATFFKYN